MEASDEQTGGGVTTGSDARLGRALGALVRLVTRAPRLTLALASVATVLAGYFTVGNLGVDSNPADLFSRDLPFRRHLHEFETAFPQFEDVLLIVLDGERPDAVRHAADELAARLREEPDRFHSVFDPFGAAVFRDNALLYLPREELQSAMTTLARIAPLLTYLERRPELTGLVRAMSGAFAVAGDRVPSVLWTVADGLAASIAAARRGALEPLDWVDALTVTGRSSGDRPVILVTQPVRDYSRFLPSGPAVERTRELVEQLALDERGVRVRLTGDVALAHDELEEASRGAMMAGALAFVLVAAFLIVGLRSVRLVLSSVITLVVGLVWTAGWAALAVGELNLISVAFAVLSISLGVDFSIHLCLRLRELQADGHGVEEGLEIAARDVGGSLFLAALTTAIGFAAFTTGDFTGVAELGVIAGGGVLISLVVNLVVLPALLCSRPLRPRADVRGRDATLAVVMRPFVALLARRRTLLAGAAVLGVAALAFAPSARFDANPLNLRNPDAESVRAFRDLASDPETTPYRASVVAEAANAAEVARELESLDVVAATIRLEDLVPADQMDKLALVEGARAALGEPPQQIPSSRSTDAELVEALDGLREALARLPAEGDGTDAVRALISEVESLRSGLIERSETERRELVRRVESSALGGLPRAMTTLRGLVRTDGVQLDDIPAAHRARWVTADGRRRVEARPVEDLADAEALGRFVDAVLATAPSATGGPIVVAESARVAVEAFQIAFVSAAVAMAVLLLAVLRSVRDVMVILTVLGYAVLMTIGIAELVGLTFNFANVIALPLLLGMSVDNAIHVVHRARVDPAAVSRLAATSTARAVLFSSLTTLGGFGTLVVSPHPGTASLGLLLTIGVLANLACTLVLLPLLLSRGASPAARAAN